MEGVSEKEINKLDLSYQFIMLAKHVEQFLETVSSNRELSILGAGDGCTDETRVYTLIDKDLEPMRNRLKTIKSLYKEKSGE